MAERYEEFEVGWFADPLYFGDYPPSMRDRVGSRLPSFTDEERELVMGSNDFFGFNHYTSWCVPLAFCIGKGVNRFASCL